MSVKWTKERREKFMQTLKIKKGKKPTNDLEDFLDNLWHRFSLQQKRSIINSMVPKSD